jgi:CRP-like cAMP-binding protein
VAVTVRRVVLIDARIAPPPHIALLRGVPLLAPLPEATLERLAYAATTVRCEAGGTVFRRGDTGDRFYVVVEGTVEILGRHFGPGECFGEIALLREVPRTATVTAVSDVLLLALDRDDFIPAVTGHAGASGAADDLVAARLLRG